MNKGTCAKKVAIYVGSKSIKPVTEIGKFGKICGFEINVTSLKRTLRMLYFTRSERNLLKR